MRGGKHPGQFASSLQRPQTHQNTLTHLHLCALSRLLYPKQMCTLKAINAQGSNSGNLVDVELDTYDQVLPGPSHY